MPGVRTLLHAPWPPLVYPECGRVAGPVLRPSPAGQPERRAAREAALRPALGNARAERPEVTLRPAGHASIEERSQFPECPSTRRQIFPALLYPLASGPPLEAPPRPGSRLRCWH